MDKTPTTRFINNPRLFALGALICWSFGAYWYRMMSLKSSFLQLSVAYFFALAVLLGYFLISRGRFFIESLKKTRLTYAVMGLFGYFIYGIAFVKSFQAFNSASETTILNYTWPIFTVIFTDYLFRPRKDTPVSLTITKGIGIFLGFLSVVILATRGEITSFHINLEGIAWGLVAGISYGIFGAYSSTVSGEEQGNFLVTAIFSSFILMVLVSARELPDLRLFTPQDMFVTAGVGCVSNGLGYLFWTRANRLAEETETPVAAIASLMFALPLLSLVIITVLLHEELLFKPYFIASILLIILSSIVCQKSVGGSR